MSDEKEIVTNITEEIKEGTDNKEAIVEGTKVEDAKEKEKKDDTINLEAEIIRQVEYYFGDVNLPRDKFLSEQIQLDDGWVPLAILIKFNRLSKLTTDLDLIENALKKSTSGILEVADKRVRRNPKLPVPEMNEDRRKDIMARSIYAKGFPKDSTLDEILRFFRKYEEVENIIMRRYLDQRTKERLFKGSIFATFKTMEQAARFMKDKDSIKYNGTDLLVMWQEEYGALKQKERSDRLKKKEKKIKQTVKSELKLPTGTVVYFEEGHEKMTREEIKAAFSKIDANNEIAYIDYKIGLTRGWIRFSKENGAVEFLKLLNDGNIVIGEYKVALKLLEGDEEKTYLQKTHEEMSKKRNNKKTFKHKGKNNYKGKQMKRKRDSDSKDAPPAKVKCQS